jgi:hypothetical protein
MSLNTASTLNGHPAAAPAPQFASLTRQLDAGRSAAFSFFGDSTGDSDGSVAANDRTSARFARQLARRYPSHHVLMRAWDATNEDFFPWVTMQAQAAGRRYAAITTRSLRYVPSSATALQPSANVVDVRALVSLQTLTPSSDSTILCSARKDVSGTISNDLQWEFRLKSTGALSMRFSTDGAAYATEKLSTATLSGVALAGAPIWLRCVQTVTPNSGYSFSFYTSTDGVAWTQLGTTISGTNASQPAMWTPSTGHFVEVGGFGWQPVATPLTGAQFYEVDVRDGAGGPSVVPRSINRWERYGDSSTTYGGAPTLYVLNASRSGSAMSYHTDPTRLKKETPDYGQVLAIFNDSHNEATSTGSLWVPPYQSWVQSVQGRLTSATIAVIGQNPHTSAWANEAQYGPEHVTRIFELSALAAASGWAFVNIYQAYQNDARSVVNLIGPDGLHPTPDGYALSGDTVARAAGIL